ncbi:MAG: hypothetical protein NTY48_05760 [Candidatus Diapherotrites archaeon]|nr:hypothetical protein [Candidatus Diapherotrites archaeon]
MSPKPMSRKAKRLSSTKEFPLISIGASEHPLSFQKKWSLKRKSWLVNEINKNPDFYIKHRKDILASLFTQRELAELARTVAWKKGFSYHVGTPLEVIEERLFRAEKQNKLAPYKKRSEQMELKI